MKRSYRDALREGLREALQQDARVFLMGEDVGRYGGTYAVSSGLLDEFGPERIRDTPLSELGFVGAGIGAALGGLRPIVEIMTVNFSLLALDPIVNTAAALRHMSGGQFSVPLVIRMATGAGRQLAAQHSHSLEGWYAHVPGLKVLAPATVADARGMLALALADPDPVIVFEHVQLYNLEEEVPEDTSGKADGDGQSDEGNRTRPNGKIGAHAAMPLAESAWRAAVRRRGTDLTLIAWSGCLPKTMAAAEALVAHGLDAEVIDLRVLRPLDTDTIIESVRRTHRALIVDEGWRSGSLSAEISARIMEQAFYELDAPVGRVCSAEVPVPYARALEEAALPQVPAIVAAALSMAAVHA